MKRRSKEEVEIRNTLSELLILSLRFSDRALLLYTILLYCQFADLGVGSKVRLSDLLEKNGKYESWLKSSWKEVSKEPSFHGVFGVFKVDSENNIQIKSDFEDHLSTICAKVKGYWSLVSRLYSEEKKHESGVQDVVTKGILLFNEGFYFECHEFLEEAWKREGGKEKSFLKGLIHAAVAFYHLEYENYKGTLNYLSRSYLRLKEFEPVFLGMDVKAFLVDIEGFLNSLQESESPILKNAIPKIRFV